MNRPNIFDYATKELSQDAMICWLLECCNCDGVYKSIGEDFIRRFIFAEDGANHEELRLLRTNLQYYRMDVFALILKGNTIHPVIFENKTDTFLSNHQLQDYCNKVMDWLSSDKWLNELKKKHQLSDDCKWGQVQYLLFKTGYIFESQKEFFDEKKTIVLDKHNSDNICVEIRDIDDILEFLCRNIKSDQLVSDYFQSCQKKKDEQQEAFDFWDSTDSKKRNKSLNTHIGQTQLFRYAFEDAPDREFERNSNSGTWTAYNLIVPPQSGSEQPYYCFRFDWRNNERAFFLQQYRNERYVKNSNIQQKQADFIHASDLSRKIIENLQEKYKVRCEQKTPSFGEKTYDGKEVFRIYVNDESLPRDVGKFIAEFTKEFLAQYSPLC